jgi:hypothetical protein
MRGAMLKLSREAFLAGAVGGFVVVASATLGTFYPLPMQVLRDRQARRLQWSAEKWVHESSDLYDARDDGFDDGHESIEDGGRLAVYQFNGVPIGEVVEMWRHSFTVVLKEPLDASLCERMTRQNGTKCFGNAVVASTSYISRAGEDGGL